ncbi:extradiol dioxygenase [Brevibacillus choshinensis]|uniref:Extradiol dioxygenase n=1 Tax=Brevibacillus choshinensis TaxID=54911 RepID=A0ABR5N6V9_BRECH|nr:VOC family protein [Brevibacillus choshinensis]KQL46373.1 extradiol dioxygenase [Brevibacillus choshinensis]
MKDIPEGYRTVTPWIISRDTTRLIAFVKEAFHAYDDNRVYNEDGTIGHAEVRIGDSVVMMFDAKEEWPDTPSFLRLYFEDGDAVYQQALQAGATPVTEMTTLFFGDRVGRVRDPLGNIWWIQTRIEDLTPEEMAKRAGQSEYIEAMRYVQGSLRLTPSTES